MSVATIVVDVVYALPGRQASRRVTLPDGSTVRDAVRASGLLGEFPEIDPTCVGIFGRRAQPASRLRDHDRVEIYRPLRADPKELRRRRASL